MTATLLRSGAAKSAGCSSGNFRCRGRRASSARWRGGTSRRVWSGTDWQRPGRRGPAPRRSGSGRCGRSPPCQPAAAARGDAGRSPRPEHSPRLVASRRKAPGYDGRWGRRSRRATRAAPQAAPPSRKFDIGGSVANGKKVSGRAAAISSFRGLLSGLLRRGSPFPATLFRWGTIEKGLRSAHGYLFSSSFFFGLLFGTSPPWVPLPCDSFPLGYHRKRSPVGPTATSSLRASFSGGAERLAEGRSVAGRDGDFVGADFVGDEDSGKERQDAASDDPGVPLGPAEGQLGATAGGGGPGGRKRRRRRRRRWPCWGQRVRGERRRWLVRRCARPGWAGGPMATSLGAELHCLRSRS